MSSALKGRLRKYPLYQWARRFYWEMPRRKHHYARKLSKLTQANPLYLLKLLLGVRRIKSLPLAQLQDRATVEKIISNVGLSYDAGYKYGDDRAHMNFGPGLWQIPRQLAEALCLLSRQNIKTAVELGTYNGWTTSIIAAYLSRFQADFSVTTVDPYPHFRHYRIMRKFVPVTYLPYKTVLDVQHYNVDFCFIDGDHEYIACKLDYDLLGAKTRVCMLHDINDRYVGPENTPRLWEEIKAAERDRAEFHEFTYHSRGEAIMGIGIRIRTN